MRQSVRLGRVAGIPVGVNWSVFVILALIADILATSVLPSAQARLPVAVYWAVAIPTALLFLASLLAHEAAHALVARRKGVEVRSITLWMLGGVAQFEGEPKTARAELQIAAAGPLTSLLAGVVLVLAAAVGAAAGAPNLVRAGLAWTGAMNGLLAVFNLLPGAPLDGGRVLRALLWMRYRDRARADRVATGAGQLLGAVLMGGGLAEVLILGQAGGLWLTLVGWFLIWAAGMEAQVGTVRAAAEGASVAEIMTRDPDCAPAWRPIGDFITGVAVSSRQNVFPVVGFEGEPRGVVTLAQLSKVPATRVADRVDSVALPLPDGYLAAPDDPATSLVGRAPLGGVLLAVVVGQGRVIGVVTVDDLGRFVERSRLRQKAAPFPAG